MPIRRLTHAFSAGELSPLMNARVDFERYQNGCRELTNAVCRTQGPASRRSGFRFIYDLSTFGITDADDNVRIIPFIFNELQSYALIFFETTALGLSMVVGDKEGLLLDINEDVLRLVMPNGWDLTNFDWAQSGDEMYIAQSGLAPRAIRRLDVDDWEVALINFVSPPTDWESGTPGAGYPERVTFHQQRLVFAANTLRRQTVWMSKAGDFLNFTAGTDGHDAVTFTLDSGTQNKITWIHSARSLNIGTLGNEWTVTGATSSALTPTNILAERQTNNGSETNKPLMVGVTTLFVERHGRVINEFVYDFNVDSYKTSDMSILSNHITEKYSIVDWTYQQTPDSVIWAIREDGDLLGITYQRQHEVIGWHRHETQGQFKALTSIPGDSREDELWTVVRRELGGEVRYLIEKQAEVFKGDAIDEGRFLDSYLTYDGSSISTVTGLDHLEGAEVSILANGTLHPTRVVENGSVTLNKKYSKLVIGLNFTSLIKPHLGDISSNQGTAFNSTQRITRVVLDLYKSTGGCLGKIDEDGNATEEQLLFRRNSDPMGSQTPLFTGPREIEYGEGFDREPIYYVKQDQPLPMTLRAVTDEIEVQR